VLAVLLQQQRLALVHDASSSLAILALLQPVCGVAVKQQQQAESDSNKQHKKAAVAV
jgi:hypothetical protein